MTNFNSTLDNFIKNYISLAVLRVEGFAEGAPRKVLKQLICEDLTDQF